MPDVKYAHEWISKRGDDDLHCRICGVRKWRSAVDRQPPCDGEEIRLVDGNPVVVVRKPDAQA